MGSLLALKIIKIVVDFIKKLWYIKSIERGTEPMSEFQTVVLTELEKGNIGSLYDVLAAYGYLATKEELQNVAMELVYAIDHASRWNEKVSSYDVAKELRERWE